MFNLTADTQINTLLCIPTFGIHNFLFLQPNYTWKITMDSYKRTPQENNDKCLIQGSKLNIYVIK